MSVVKIRLQKSKHPIPNNQKTTKITKATQNATCTLELSALTPVQTRTIGIGRVNKLKFRPPKKAFKQRDR